MLHYKDAESLIRLINPRLILDVRMRVDFEKSNDTDLARADIFCYCAGFLSILPVSKR